MKRISLLVGIVFMSLYLSGCMFTMLGYFSMMANANRKLREQSHTVIIPTNIDSLRKINAINLAELQTKYEGEDGVYMDYDESYETLGYDVGFAGRTVYCRHIRYTILNPDEKSLSTFECEVNRGEELAKMFAVVISPDGSVKMYGKDDCKVQENDGTVSYKIAYPDVKKGTVIEEGVEIKNVFRSTFFFQRGMPVQHMRFKHVYTKDRLIAQKQSHPTNTPVLQLTSSPEEDFSVRLYEKENVSSWKSEAFSPYKRDVVPYYEFVERSANSTNIDWSDIGGQYGYFSADNSDWTSKKVDEFARTLTKGCTSKAQMVDTLVLYVQKKIRCVTSRDADWSSAIKNKEYEDILDEQMGPPMPILGLAQAMLRANGIEAYFVLLCDKTDGYFDERDPRMASFATCAILAKTEGKSFLVFPDEKEIPPNYVPEPFQGSRAMQIADWSSLRSAAFGSRAQTNFITLETDNMLPTQTLCRFEMEIKDDGTINVKETQTYNGLEAYAFRREFKTMKEDAIAKRVKDFASYSSGDVKIAHYTVEGKNSALVPFVVTLEYTINNLVTVTPEEIIFQTSGLFSPSTEAKSKFETEKRVNPIQIHYASRLLKDVKVKYPASWTMTTALKDVSIHNDLGDASVQYTQGGSGELGIKIERSMKRGSHSKDKLPDLIELVGRRSSLQVPTMIFKAK